MELENLRSVWKIPALGAMTCTVVVIRCSKRRKYLLVFKFYALLQPL